MNAGILSSYTVDTNTATQGDPKLHSAARRAKTHDSTLVLGQNSSELPSPQISGHSDPICGSEACRGSSMSSPKEFEDHNLL